jgi:hypothetical protein
MTTLAAVRAGCAKTYHPEIVKTSQINTDPPSSTNVFNTVNDNVETLVHTGDHGLGSDTDSILMKIRGNVCVRHMDQTGQPRSDISGVMWWDVTNSRCQSLLGQAGLAPLENVVKLNAIAFAAKGGRSHCVHNSSNVEELYSEMLNMPDAEIVKWIKSCQLQQAQDA